MNINAYSVKDAKSGTFGNPYYAQNDALAARSFEQASNDPNTTINAYPEDFSLYRVGSFNDESGEFKPEPQPQFITNATIKSKASEAVEESI
jgi:hypothetical protein